MEDRLSIENPVASNTNRLSSGIQKIRSSPKNQNPMSDQH